MYLLIRPFPKLAGSTQAFLTQGLAVTGIATADIDMLSDGRQNLTQALASLAAGDIVVVTSTFAAQALGALMPELPKSVAVVAVGSSTAGVLGSTDMRVFTPGSHDSEGILALPVLEQVSGRNVAIIKGVGGRTLLRETLEQRGAHVTEVPVYERVALSKPKETNHWQWKDVKGIIVTSQEMAAPLFTYYDKSRLINLPWLTVSSRIGEFLSLQGVKQVAIAEGASDRALIKWVKENWE